MFFIRYEKFANAFDGFQGFFAETTDQIKDAFRLALKETKRPSIINIAINPSADRKAQVLKIWIFNTKFKPSLIFFKYLNSNFLGSQNRKFKLILYTYLV